MKKLTLFAVCVLPMLGLGCGGTGLGDDLGPVPTDMGGAADLAVHAFKLVSGSYMAQGAPTNVSDGCMQVDSSLATDVEQITNSGPGTPIGFGDVYQADTTKHIQGDGTIDNNVGTLTFSGTLNSGGCSYTYTRTNMITVTADNTFTSNYSEVDNGRTGCTPDVGATCTTTFTWSFKKQ